MSESVVAFTMGILEYRHLMNRIREQVVSGIAERFNLATVRTSNTPLLLGLRAFQDASGIID